VSPAEGAGSEKTLRVLVAEDEAIIRLDLKEMLEEEGLEIVAEAADGESAVRLARERSPDVVIMDIKMPVLDGITAARRITDDGIALVMLTAFSQRDLARRAADAGALGYVVKPFQKDDLLPAIDVAVARRRDMRLLDERNAALTDTLETRKLVDRAKGRLMDEHGLSEDDAHRYLQRRAMEERRSLKETAARLLDG
jgi:AmiR/NasT family two-component response regulator